MEYVCIIKQELFYVATSVTFNWNCVAIWQAAHQTPLFQFAMSRGSRVLLQYIAVYITLLAISVQKELEMFCFSSRTRVTFNKYVVHCKSNFHKLSEATGID